MALETLEERESVVPSEQLKRRNRPGRSSRRRKAKIRAIDEVEKKCWLGDHAIAPNINASIRMHGDGDRDQIWPGVLDRRSKLWLNTDEVTLMGQLGYIPGNAVAVAARSSKLPELGIEGEVPIVLQLYPIAIRNAYAGGKSDGRKFKSRKRGPTKTSEVEDDEHDMVEPVLIEPFPTMYWLTHPLLRALTSKLEVGETHCVRMLERRLSTDEHALERMKSAHKAYGDARWNLLTSQDQAEMERRQWKESLSVNVGVAGIRKSIAIKCLHAHLAHHLSGGPGSDDNVVGKWVLQELRRIVVTQHER